VAPAGTPKDVINRYADALAKVMAQPDLRAKLEQDGFEPVARNMTPDQLAAYIRSETERWGKVIKASGATVD
jgi:tripartite-type tricarboxylate transporter receptor subunit TctC